MKFTTPKMINLIEDKISYIYVYIVDQRLPEYFIYYPSLSRILEYEGIWHLRFKQVKYARKNAKIN